MFRELSLMRRKFGKRQGMGQVPYTAFAASYDRSYSVLKWANPLPRSLTRCVYVANRAKSVTTRRRRSTWMTSKHMQSIAQRPSRIKLEEIQCKLTMDFQDKEPCTTHASRGSKYAKRATDGIVCQRRSAAGSNNVLHVCASADSAPRLDASSGTTSSRRMEQTSSSSSRWSFSSMIAVRGRQQYRVR